MTGILLALIALILFYKLVEREHKLLLGKILGALVLVAASVAAILYYVQQANLAGDTERLASVTVMFVAPRPGAALVRWAGSPDTVNTVSFELCNKGRRRVDFVRFYPLTYRAGRSTPYDLPVSPYRQDFVLGSLTSDYVLPPRDCVKLTWKGWYQVFDSVSVRVEEVRAATP